MALHLHIPIRLHSAPGQLQVNRGCLRTHRLRCSSVRQRRFGVTCLQRQYPNRPCTTACSNPLLRRPRVASQLEVAQGILHCDRSWMALSYFDLASCHVVQRPKVVCILQHLFLIANILVKIRKFTPKIR